MTADELKIATALGKVVFFPGTKTKRLSQNMAALAVNKPDYELTPRQREAILDIAVKFRRQIPADVVELAQRLQESA